MPRKSQSDFKESELTKMIDAIIKKKAHNRIKSRELYKELVQDFVINGRSANAMQLAMYQQIAPNFEKYCSASDAKKFNDHFYKNNKNGTSEPAKKSRNRMESTLSDSESDSSSSDSDVSFSDVVTPTKKIRNSPRKRKFKSDEEDEDDEVERPSKQTRSKSPAEKKQKRVSFIDSDDDIQVCEEFVKPKTRNSKKNEPSFSTISDFSVAAELFGKKKTDGVGDALLATVDVHQPPKQQKAVTSNGVKKSAIQDDFPSASDITNFSTGDLMAGHSKCDPVGNEFLRHLGLEPSPKKIRNSSTTPSKLPFVLLEDCNKTPGKKQQKGQEASSPESLEKISPMDIMNSPAEDLVHDAEETRQVDPTPGEFDSLLNESMSDFLLGKKQRKHNEAEARMVKAFINKKAKAPKVLKLSNGVKGTGGTLTKEKQAFLSMLKENRKHKLPEANTDEEDNETEEEFEAEKNQTVDGKIREEDKTSDEQPAELEAAKDLPPPVEPQVEQRKPPEKKTQNAGNLMIAVGTDIRGKQCFFKLIPMTEEEVDSIDGPCIPFQLHPPALVNTSMVPFRTQLRRPNFSVRKFKKSFSMKK